MPIVNRFTVTDKGATIITGNTLGLGLNNQEQGAFITLNLADQVPGYPPGTTLVWQDNESSAELNIPAGAEVIYAELQWGGSSVNNSQDVSAFLNNAITFTTPSGVNMVFPDPATAQEEVAGAVEFYSRSQDVTSIVQAAGSGTYTVGGVPATIVGNNNTSGWTLGVVYRDSTQPARNMSIYAGIQGVAANSGPIDIPISNFLTPPTGPVEGRVLISAMEGDFAISGDQALFGPNIGGLAALSGPNNQVNNFFQSFINDGDSESPTVGQLDTTGTFGNLNLPALPARYGWDITNVPINNLANNQSDAILRVTTSGDAYAVTFLGIQLDALLDFGDAPDTDTSTQGMGNYRTLFDSDGPRHGIINNLTLGSSITNEDDAYENATATGDDLIEGIQDDGVSIVQSIVVGESNYLVDVSYVNDTGDIANLYGWVDFNQNGIFELGESAGVSILPSTGPGIQQATLNFTIPAGTTLMDGDETFMRLRLTTENLLNTNTQPTEEDTRSFGTALDGEVEDYRVLVVSFEVNGVVWYDLDCDGIREAGEILLEGVNVNLFNADTGELVATTSTDVTGSYSFTDIPAGNYYVVVDLPNGYEEFTIPNVGADDSIDSDVNQNTRRSENFTLSEDNRIETIDAGVCKCFKISGQAFYDCNKNGILDNDEPFIYGVTVILFNELEQQVGCVYTDCDGYYEFPCLKPGEYLVQFIAPPNMNFSPQVLGQEYGSKPDSTTGQVLVTILDEDITNIYAGFTGNLGMNMKYCNSCNNNIGCSVDKKSCNNYNGGCVYSK